MSGDTERIPLPQLPPPPPSFDIYEEDERLRNWVALIVAIGLALAVNAITLAVLIDALRSDGPGLSENATQVLTGAFGGMLALLGTAIGYRAGARAALTRQLLEEIAP